MREFKIWRDELLDEIRTISDLNELERLWSGADKSRISSFAEEVAHIFDDYEIDEFLIQDPIELGISSEQMKRIGQFRDSFCRYLDQFKAVNYSSISFQEILGDEMWQEVSMMAGKVADSP